MIVNSGMSKQMIVKTISFFSLLAAAFASNILSSSSKVEDEDDEVTFLNSVDLSVFLSVLDTGEGRRPLKRLPKVVGD